MFDSSMVTAICAVLGVIGGLIMWLHNLIQARMPYPSFSISNSLPDHIYRVTIYFKRIKYVYRLENIESKYNLYADYSGLDHLGRGTIKLCHQLDKSSIKTVIPSCHQTVKHEPFIDFYVDLKEYKEPIYTMRVLFKSEHFPFGWGRRIDIPLT